MKARIVFPLDQWKYKMHSYKCNQNNIQWEKTTNLGTLFIKSFIND